MLSIAINVLNEKEVKYKFSQKNGVSSMLFGLLTQGVKNKIEVLPSESEITVKIFDIEKKFTDEVGFGGFINTIIELKALQEKENALIDQLKAV